MKRLMQVIAIAIALSLGGTQFVNADMSSQVATAKDSPKTQLNECTREAMVAALTDERRSEAQYSAVIKKFGEVRPFINIIQAERRHQAMLLELFKKYDVAVPANELPEEIAPATLRAACEAGVKSEKENVALYDEFLKDIKEPDIRQVFTKLRDASKWNHLPAFERCAAGGGRGRGQGHGQGCGNR